MRDALDTMPLFRKKRRHGPESESDDARTESRLSVLDTERES
ncbi:MAG: hypothetical protein Q7S25_05380 [Candidatus Limnocylindria bacterium]|nr:hypothetical protein [Candidatus Limnocylindria bacterium]